MKEEKCCFPYCKHIAVAKKQTNKKTQTNGYSIKLILLKLILGSSKIHISKHLVNQNHHSRVQCDAPLAPNWTILE